MSRKVIGLTIVVACIGIGLGVVIGYFSHTPKAPTNPEWVATVETFFRDLDEDFLSTFVDGIQADNIRNNLQFFADQPHMATSPRDEALANHINQLWTDQLDSSSMKAYQIMHGLLSEDPNKPNTFTVVDESNNEFFRSRQTEIVYEEYMKNPESIVPYFNAFGPPGDVQGKIIYANFARDEDFQALQAMGVNTTGTIALVQYGGGVGRGGKASNAQKYGVIGVLVYSDPAVYSVDGEKGYPVDSSLPGTGVQRGSTISDFGDPSTPGYPSTDYAYRVPVQDIDQFPPLPLQPIAYDDAEALLRDMGGDVAPSDWVTRLDVDQIKVGPGFDGSNATREVHLVTNNRYEVLDSYNVIGTIVGSEEPDKIIMFGNHRDSWVYGAVDPSSGTSCMMEITRMLGELRKAGWKPRRTLMFASWGSEEFGLLGSNEWLEDHWNIADGRMLSYINLDIAVFANQSFAAAASPLMSKVLYDAASRVMDPTNTKNTVKDTWMENFPNSENTNPQLRKLSTSSDYASFYQSLGVTSADLSYRGNANSDPRYKISPYPTYHTAYDTFDYVDRFVDPGFVAHWTVSRVSGLIMLLLSDSLVIPFDVKNFAAFVNSQVVATESEFGTLLADNNISLEYLKRAGNNFVAQAQTFQSYIDTTLDRKDPKSINAVNDRLLLLERNFIEPKGLPGTLQLKHVSGSPASTSGSYASFPGLKDSLYGISSGQLQQWEVVKQQLALVTYKIEMAAQFLILNS